MKAWSRTKNYKRKVEITENRKAILIVCGGKTEKLYFESLKRSLRPKCGIDVVCQSKDPMKLVKFGIAKMNENKYSKIWCVYDKDDNSIETLESVAKEAKQNNIRVIFSNTCFEYWLVLHFSQLGKYLKPRQMVTELEKHLKRDYKKPEENIYEELEENLNDAIERSKKIHSRMKKHPYGEELFTNFHEFFDFLKPFC